MIIRKLSDFAQTFDFYCIYPNLQFKLHIVRQFSYLLYCFFTNIDVIYIHIGNPCPQAYTYRVYNEID